MISCDDKTRGAICIIASAFGFAVMAACVRLCDDYGAQISSFQKSFFRNLIAFLIALAVFKREGGCLVSSMRLSRKAWKAMILRSVAGTIGIFANFYALGHIPIAEGQTLNKTAPFFTVLFAWILLGERIRTRHLLPLLCAFSGVLLITKPGFADANAGFPMFMGLLGGIAAGLAYVAVRYLGILQVSSAAVVLVFSMFSCVASIPFILVDHTPMTIAQVGVLLGAGIGAAIGQFGVTAAYRYAKPRDIAVFDYTNILFTLGMGYLLFGQMPDHLSILGFVCIIAAAFLMKRLA